jgi:hypothetical protein
MYVWKLNKKEGSCMKRYKEFQPTLFDPKGICLEDKQEWFVVPVSQTRDSGCLSRSNFHVALELLGEESETVEVHRFGHWGPGWFEIIIVNPSDLGKVKIAEKIEKSLEEYPVLNDSHFSAMKWEEAAEYWKSMPIRERVELCQKYKCNILHARHEDTIPQDDDGSLFEYLTSD